MHIDILTIFPEMFAAVLGESILKRAQAAKKVSIAVHDLRDYTTDRHRKVDDRPFGGGSGMVMCCQPIFDAVAALKTRGRKAAKSPGRQAARSPVRRGKAKVILMCPQGKKFDQKTAQRLSRQKRLILICGHYEGIDERVRQNLCDEEISIGDYVLTGGELAAMVVVDAVVRLVPGVLGDKNSLNFESFEGNLLEYPQYTRPADFRGLKAPEVLTSGDHATIAAWRKRQALKRTQERRPDLLVRHTKRSVTNG